MTDAPISTMNGEVTVQNQIDTLAWLLAELAHRLNATAILVAGMMAQQMQPDIQKAILGKLMNP